MYQSEEEKQMNENTKKQMYSEIDPQLCIKIMEDLTEERNQLKKEYEQQKEKLESAENKLQNIQNKLKAGEKELQITKEKLQDNNKKLLDIQQQNNNLNQSLQEAKEQTAVQDGILWEKEAFVKSLQQKNLYQKRIMILLTFLVIGVLFGGLYFYKMKDEQLEQVQTAYKSLQKKSSSDQSLLENTNEQLEQVQTDYKDLKEKSDIDQSLLKKANEQLEQVKENFDYLKEEYSQFMELLDKPYGYGSENYYSNKDIVVMKEGDTEKISIYGTISTTYVLDYYPNSGIDCKWGKTHFSNNKEDVTITAYTAGVYTISFWNEKNKDKFNVLVIVNEE